MEEMVQETTEDNQGGQPEIQEDSDEEADYPIMIEGIPDD